MPHQPVMHRILIMPAMPFSQFHQPPYSQTFSLESHQRSPCWPNAIAPLMADSKSLHTAIMILMATITNGKTLNHSVLPMLHLYLSIIKPMQPAVAAYSFA